MLNNDWKSYINKKDKIVKHFQINDVLLKWRVLLLFLLPILFVLYLLAFGGIYAVAGMAFMIIEVLCVYSLIVCFVYLGWKSNHFVLTNNGIYRISGLFVKRVKYVPYKRVVDVSISRGIIENMLGLGSVGCGTASGGNHVSTTTGAVQMNEIDFIGIKDYKKVQEYILSKIG